MKNLYVINYKETIIDDCNVIEVECGTFDYGYENLDEAKKVLADIAQKKIEELDCDADDDEKIEENWNGERDFISILFREDTYDYYIKTVLIAD